MTVRYEFQFDFILSFLSGMSQHACMEYYLKQIQIFQEMLHLNETKQAYDSCCMKGKSLAYFPNRTKLKLMYFPYSREHRISPLFISQTPTSFQIWNKLRWKFITNKIDLVQIFHQTGKNIPNNKNKNGEGGKNNKVRVGHIWHPTLKQFFFSSFFSRWLDSRLEMKTEI